MKTHSIHTNDVPRLDARINRDQAKGGRVISRLACFALMATTACVGMATGNAQTPLSKALAAAQSSSVGTVRNGLFNQGGKSYQVVKAASYATATDVGTTVPGSVAQVALNGCNSCGTSCGGRCSGSRSRFARFDDGCNNGLADVCAPCEPYCYALVEGLYIERDGDEDFTTSPDFFMNGFDYEWAGRVTVGRVPDCVHGCEFSYTGLMQWDMFGSATDPGFGIDTFLTPGAPLLAANVSAFSNASFQSQDYEVDYWSVEANRTLMGWDVAKLLYGVRYLEYDEQYRYFSQNATENGLLQSNVENQMFGLQVGLDLLYPISRRGYSDFRLRAGAYLNSTDSDVSLINDNILQVRNVDDGYDLAKVLEVGAGVRYRFGMLSIRGGAEVWYLGGVATSVDQFQSVITPLTGRKVSTDDDILMTGLSLGAELRY